jgi:hypothetical protein
MERISCRIAGGWESVAMKVILTGSGSFRISPPSHLTHGFVWPSPCLGHNVPLGDGRVQGTAPAGQGVIRGVGPRRGCHAPEGERMKHNNAACILPPSQTAQAEVAKAGIRQFFCRGLIPAVDRRKANGPVLGRHGRGLGKRGFGAPKGENGMDKGREEDTTATGGSRRRRGSPGEPKVLELASQPTN